MSFVPSISSGLTSLTLLTFLVQGSLSQRVEDKYRDVSILSMISSSSHEYTDGHRLNSIQDDQLPIPIRGGKYELTFEDNFKSIDSIAQTANARDAKWYNGVEQCCMSDSTGLPAVNYPSTINGLSVNPYSIDENHGLKITLSKVNNVWYSGVLTSVNRFGEGFYQQYGYFEIRAKLPRGQGTWPAFWMKSLSMITKKDDLGELDIFEQYGNNDHGFCTTYHDWTNKTTPYYNCNNPTPDLTNDFHTWGLLWTESKMIVYFDGKPINSAETPHVAKQPYYLLMDMGLGGGWPTDKTPEQNVMQVEYVRVYKQM